MDELEKLKIENAQLRQPIRSNPAGNMRLSGIICPIMNMNVIRLRCAGRDKDRYHCPHFQGPAFVSKEQQAVYDVIKSVREGNPTKHTFDGIEYLIVPLEDGEKGFFVYDGKTIPYSYYLCQDVLCKYHGNKIGIMTINWKDAGPNPRLHNGYGFIPFKNVYGIAIKVDEIKKEGSNGNSVPSGS